VELLFISYRDVQDKSYGGAQCTNRNYLSLCELIGSNNVEVVNLANESRWTLYNRILKRINYLFGFKEGLSFTKLKVILNHAKDKDFVFIDSSAYGIIAYYLKKVKFTGEIICFFHNVEINLQKEKARRNPLTIWQIFLYYYNEKNALKYADKIVVLNTCDKDELKRIYGANQLYIIPISLHDTLPNYIEEFTSVPPTLIFVGNNWYPNLHGLKWFITNILDDVNIKLQIVGSGMENLKNEFLHPKIEFLGYVSNISTLMIQADYFVCPIFLGGGMKVKICEALMYGKNIISTRTALEGYEIDFTLVGEICNSKEEFLSAIKGYCSKNREKFNVNSRKSYLEKYSFQATLKEFEELLKI